ncbi:UNVERIFIED_CONTAM: hypothetical protein FKN15_034841 [Acipenser sinensis]
MGILEKISEIEKEISRTQKNKATEYHLGLLKAKLAKYRAQLLEPSKSAGAKGEGFDVMKSGDARVALIGFPSVGKSTFLSLMTSTASEAASYEFTTLTCIPGVIEYKGANIQLLDLPGIIEGASQGKGRGRQVIAVARTADVVIMMLDATKGDVQRVLLEKELESVGIRLNVSKPNIYFKPKKGGGLSYNSTVPLTQCSEKLVQLILHEYKIFNAEVLFREDSTPDEFIDVIVGNRVYMNCVYVYNKIDQISMEEVDRLARRPHSVVISCGMKLNLDYLLERLWEYLALICIYTKKRGAIMKFMGDYPLKGDTEQDVIGIILKHCGEHAVMKDETYCQIIKQVTCNASSKPDSCQRGWRILYIVTAYYGCSEVLKPFLLRFIQDISRSPGLHFQGIAKACEQNLRKTFRFGGRIDLPSGMELKAMVAGRSLKRQLFLLPGGIERHLKIKTCSVALDVIEELCYEMALHRPEALDEYAIFVVTNRGKRIHSPSRVHEVLPDYLKALLIVLPQGKVSEPQLQQVSKLAALQHRAKDSIYLPTVREVQEYIPPVFWAAAAAALAEHGDPAHAAGLGSESSPGPGTVPRYSLVSAFPMFGSSFFYIQSSSNSSIVSPCVLAINQNGLNFLNKETHELTVKFPLKEVQSTRTQRPTAGSSVPYVEIMLGDLSQCITQLQLEQGLELCRVIAMHMDNLLSAREKRLTLPPSEITLL